MIAFAYGGLKYGVLSKSMASILLTVQLFSIIPLPETDPFCIPLWRFLGIQQISFN